METRRRASTSLGVAALATLLCVQLLGAGSSRGQEPSPSTSTTTAPPTTVVAPTVTSAPTTTTTTTTTPGASTSTTAPAPSPSTTVAPPPATTAVTVEPAEPTDDGESTGSSGPRTVPSDAQAIIDAYPRTAPNGSASLLAAIDELVDLGLTRDEAIRVGFGAFPIAGVSTFVDDWLFPRFGPGFRFHQGTDVFAPYGTPLRAVADGIVTAKDSGLGGLSVRVTVPDGTFYYYAHLSALPDDFKSGMSVLVGDIVGFVGDSGNARGGSPHLHFGIYAQGGAAINPKPVLDRWLADAAAELPALVAEVRSAQGAAGDGRPNASASARGPRSMLATSLVRGLAGRTAAGAVSTDVLYQASANPSTGGVAVAETEATRLAASIDWESRAATEALAVQVVDALLGRAGD